MAAFFITGTDTDCGKTLLTLGLMQAFQQSGLQVNAMKPVAAGVTQYKGLQLNQDAVMLQQQSSVEPEYQLLNPYLFEPAIAPHIAAAEDNVVIDMESIRQAFQSLRSQAEVTLVEGAGGWLVPLNEQFDVGDIPQQLELPVILIVGLKLGCINHARLSLQSVRAKGCQVAGWVGTQLDPDMSHARENIATLKRYLDTPCLGVVPFLKDAVAGEVAGYLTIDELVKTE